MERIIIRIFRDHRLQSCSEDKQNKTSLRILERLRASWEVQDSSKMLTIFNSQAILRVTLMSTLAKIRVRSLERMEANKYRRKSP
jgi:hypothetical protein